MKISRYALFVLVVITPLSTLALSLTEIYVDGTDEYIELTNTSSGTQSGIVILSGIKHQPVSLSYILSGGSSRVYADQANQLSGMTNYSSGHGRSLGDTSPIDWTLRSSTGTLLQSIGIDGPTIQSLNNTDTALEHLSGSRQAIPIARTHGVLSGYRANPGLRGQQLLDVLNSQGTGSISTGIVQDDFELRIIEVMVDSTSERIEIMNVGTRVFDDFFTLVGAKASPLEYTLTIQPGEIILLADVDDFYTTRTGHILTGQALNMPDTQALDVQLIIDGDIHDRMQIDADDIQTYNDDKRTFARLQDNQGWWISYTRDTETANATAPLIATPGLLMTRSSRSDELVHDPLIDTCPSDPWIHISELAHSTPDRSAYIELTTARTRTGGVLSFSGSGLSSGLTTSLSGEWYPGDQILLAAGSTGLVMQDIDAIRSGDIQFHSGQIIVSRHTGHVLDNLFVDMSTYPAYHALDDSCMRDMIGVDTSTPGYPHQIAEYFTTSDPIILPTIQYVPRLEGLRPAPDAGYDEAIVIGIDDDALPYTLDDHYIQIGTTKRYLPDMTLSSTGTHVLTGNRSLSNTTDRCVSLYDQNDQHLDRLCYTSDQASDGLYIGPQPRSRTTDISSGTGSTGTGTTLTGDTLSGSLIVSDIVYDPPGSDTGAESFVITNTSDHIFAARELWILIGAAQTKRFVPVGIGSGSTTVVGSFALSNARDTCVQLRSDYGQHDEYCYRIETTNDSTTDTTSRDRAADIAIIDLVYDPEGADTDRESITLILDEDENDSVDLDDYRLLVGTTRKTIDGTLRPGQPLTITRTRGFPNSKAACATLMYDHRPVDVRCYTPGDEQGVLALSGDTSDTSYIDLAAQFQIDDILYDPEGNDTNRESISIRMTIDDQSMTEYALTDAYLLINDRKKLLDGVLMIDHSTTIVDNFRFPNTGACVELRVFERLMDTYCYDDSPQSATISPSTEYADIASIQAIYPDPPGADADAERVRIQVHDTSIDKDALSLQIGDRTSRAIPTYDISNQTITWLGALALPNRLGCVSLLYADQLIDTMCYHKTTTGQTITDDQLQRHDESADVLALLNRISITTIGTGEDRRHCIRQDGILLTCKDIPAGRYRTTIGERFYRDYAQSLHRYLSLEWPQLYYRSDIAQHVDLYHIMRDTLREGQPSVTLHGQSYPSDTDFSRLWAAYRQTSYYDILIDTLMDRTSTAVTPPPTSSLSTG